MVRKVYDEAFKKSLVGEVLSGVKVPEVAGRHKVGAKAIYSWVKKYQREIEKDQAEVEAKTADLTASREQDDTDTVAAQQESDLNYYRRMYRKECDKVTQLVLERDSLKHTILILGRGSYAPELGG